MPLLSRRGLLPLAAALALGPVRAEATARKTKEGSRDFATGFLAAVASRDRAADAVVAPSSARGLLLMLASGASAAGRDHILAVLGASSGEGGVADAAAALPRSDAGLTVARALWLDPAEHINPAYRDLVVARFGADVREVTLAEPATRAALNDWIAQRTDGRIRDLLESIPAGAQLVAVDALHFKAVWAERFDPGETAPAPFRRAGGAGPVELPMMRHANLHLRSRTGDALEAVELPYEGARFAAVLLVPRDEAVDPVDALVAQGPSAAGWLRGEGFRDRTAEISVPRLGLEGSIDLIESLRPLGIRLGGQDGLGFAGISTSEPRVGLMLQKAVLRLDEAGTEAAAASAAVVTREIKPLGDKLVIRFDRPFVLAVRDVPSGELIVVAAVRAPNG